MYTYTTLDTHSRERRGAKWSAGKNERQEKKYVGYKYPTLTHTEHHSKCCRFVLITLLGVMLSTEIIFNVWVRRGECMRMRLTIYRDTELFVSGETAKATSNDDGVHRPQASATSQRDYSKIASFERLLIAHQCSVFIHLYTQTRTFHHFSRTHSNSNSNAKQKLF